MAVIHISAAEAARTFTTLLAQVRAGDEVIIEDGNTPTVVLHITTTAPAHRTISECLSLAKQREEETGTSPVLDPDFAADVEQRINNRQPWHPPTWD